MKNRSRTRLRRAELNTQNYSQRKFIALARKTSVLKIVPLIGSEILICRKVPSG